MANPAVPATNEDIEALRGDLVRRDSAIRSEIRATKDEILRLGLEVGRILHALQAVLGALRNDPGITPPSLPRTPT